MRSKISKMINFIKHPNNYRGYLYRGVDFWPPKNYKKKYRIKFYLIELPLRWIFQGLIPQSPNGLVYRTFFDEHKFIQSYFFSMNYKPIFFIEIGAGDGIDMSNTFPLAATGTEGISIEGNPLRFAQLSLNYEKFPKVQLVRKYIDSKNIISILESGNTPINFDLLNLDIDSYDYHVLHSILNKYHPKLCVIEWNRSYPPQFFFTINDDPTIVWDSKSNYFYGASLLAYHSLLSSHNYKIIAIQGAALFASPSGIEDGYPALDVNDLWNLYIKGPKEWQETDPMLLNISPESARSLIQKQLVPFKNKYTLKYNED